MAKLSKWMKRRQQIAADLGDAWGQLLIADAEYRESQDTLADVLRFYGWKCTPPKARRAA